MLKGKSTGEDSILLGFVFFCVCFLGVFCLRFEGNVFFLGVFCVCVCCFFGEGTPPISIDAHVKTWGPRRGFGRFGRLQPHWWRVVFKAKDPSRCSWFPSSSHLERGQCVGSCVRIPSISRETNLGVSTPRALCGWDGRQRAKGNHGGFRDTFWKHSVQCVGSDRRVRNVVPSGPQGFISTFAAAGAHASF